MTPSGDRETNQTEAGQDCRELVDRFLKSLLSAMNHTILYAADHPASRISLEEAHAAIGAVLDARGETILGVVGRDLVFDNSPISRQPAVCARVVEQLSKKKIEKLSFSRGVSLEELKSLVTLLASETEEEAKPFSRLLAERGVTHIVSGRLGSDKKNRKDSAPGLNNAEKDYLMGLEAMREINSLIRRRGEIKADEVSPLANLLVRGVMENQGSLMTIINIHSKDEYTATHCLDVSILTLMQVASLGLSDAVLSEIASAALLHDLGKLMIPDQILRKPGPLTDEEWDIMRRHPVLGAEIIHANKDFGRLAMVVAFEHHLRYDAKGYPRRRRPLSLNTLSHIVAVSDVYDAVRSKRAYQEELSSEKAADVLIRGSGTIFHPLMVRRFIQRVGVFGLGSAVRLSDGEVGLVTGINPHEPSRPVVRILDGPSVGLQIDTSRAEGGPMVECSFPMDGRIEELIKSSGL